MKRKTSARSDNKPERKVNGLENPFPSAPKHPAKYVIYHLGPRGTHTWGWMTLYACKRTVDILIHGREFKWVTRDQIEFDDGTTIKSPDLEDMIEYKYANDEEAGWIVPMAEDHTIMVALGRVKEKAEPKRDEDGKIVKSPRKEKAARTPRPSKEGLVTVQAIAAELKVDARDCRVVLRKMKAEKPACGWAWPAKEAEAMKKQIAAGLKK